VRIGQGFDVHRLIPNRRLVLGGVTIPYELGLLGHSDADVLIHAIMDALLGAIGAGDIGRHFPDTDPNFKDADSMKLLQVVFRMVKEAGYKVVNIDATVIAQKPKLAGHIPLMRDKLADVMSIPVSSINVKATTTEGLGFPGRGEGIAALAVALLAEDETVSI
jgi:2-C-methyl-D-erythritol 2,4-cyclodiphosphate synthase